MKRKVYWKSLFGSFTHSSCFLSILTLMLLGSLALVGPGDYSKYAPRQLTIYSGKQQKMLDLAVMGDLGLDQVDQEEL